MRVPAILFLVCAAALSAAFDYNGTPGGYAWGTEEPAATLALRVTQNWRPTSIEVVTPGSLSTKYKVAYVKNEGTHLQTCKFVYNQTPTQLNSLRSSGWRVEDVAIVRTTPDVRVSAILIRNVVNPKHTTWFRNSTTAQVTTLLGSSYRLIDLERDGGTDSSPKFAGVAIINTGTHRKAWGWMPSHSLTDIRAWESANNMRIIEFQYYWSNKACAVFVQKAPGERTALIISGENDFAASMAAKGMRPQSFNQSRLFTNQYTGIAVTNVNAQTGRIADRIHQVSGEFKVGAYVSQIGGSKLVDLRASEPFYPASAIKVLIHARGLSVVPATQLETYKIGNRLLKSIAQNMMLNSNNPDTFTLNSHWGTNAINSYGRNVLGTTTNTWIADHYGNAPPEGEFNAGSTLVDMGSIYKNVLLLGTTKYKIFHDWMLNETNTSVFNGEFNSVKSEIGISTTAYNLWKSKVTYMLKAGNYGTNGRNNNFVNCGRISLPHKVGTSHGARSYVFGHFVDEAYNYPTSTGWSVSANMLREQIKASMLTYK